MMQLSLETILQRLVRRGNQAVLTTPLESDNKTPTSIRLKPITKHFLDIQAEALNTSTQSLISMILDGVAETSTDPTAGILRTIRDRFFYIFQSHGLALVDIVNIMTKYGVSFSSFENQGKLLDLLTKEAVQHIAELFFCSPKWLMGASDDHKNYSYTADWYKKVYPLAQKLLDYDRNRLRPEVLFICREKANFDKACLDDSREAMEPIGIVIKLLRQTNEGKDFYVYQIGELQRWNYWRCREQIKLLIYFCMQTHGIISYSGYALPKEDINAIFYGRALAVDILKINQHIKWSPEKYVGISSDSLLEADEWKNISKCAEAEILKNMADQYENRQHIVQSE